MAVVPFSLGLVPSNRGNYEIGKWTIPVKCLRYYIFTSSCHIIGPYLDRANLSVSLNFSLKLNLVYDKIMQITQQENIFLKNSNTV